MKGSIKKDKGNDKKQNSFVENISFFLFGVVIFIIEILLITIAILYIILTPWKFVKQVFQIISIISLCLIVLQLIITIPAFYKTKNIELTKNLSLFSQILCLINFLFVLHILIIALNIFMAVYISKKLNIADYPEYGGRTRDEEYIKKHPNEFGDVSSKEFLIAALLPSLISFLNFFSFILCICFRIKVSNLYDILNKKNNEYMRRISITRRDSSTRKDSVKKRDSVTRRNSSTKRGSISKKRIFINEIKNDDTKE